MTTSRWGEHTIDELASIRKYAWKSIITAIPVIEWGSQVVIEY